ncbi:hypothetical protein VIBNISFn27_510021 [Vibrio nigripulchritudo SFn27]|nr:hypothetical protein VIBNISFn27_510021 [Vibrio nigripulchritudo SFn27]CCN96698.1 hypothetical protein VIBNIENn2_790021 [Vibrio nigripulchritudo ENn2]
MCVFFMLLNRVAGHGASHPKIVTMMSGSSMHTTRIGICL